MPSNASTNREFTEWLAKAFKEVNWPIPAYLTLGGFLVPLARAVMDAPQDAKLEIMRDGIASAYTPDYLAGMYLDRYSKVLHVRDFTRQIDESIRTYFCGYTFNAVTGLLPVVEGIIRKMAIRQNRDVGKGTKKLEVELQALVDQEEQSAHCYGERLVMLEAFRDFVRGAGCTQFRHPLQGYAATQCRVMPPPVAALCRRCKRIIRAEGVLSKSKFLKTRADSTGRCNTISNQLIHKCLP